MARFDPDNTVPLVMSVVSSSARGPSYSFNSIKPDIAAPVRRSRLRPAQVAGQTAFGGTSGATPMVAGSAALLIQAHPALPPAEIKALLVNTAETQIQTNPARPARSPGAHHTNWRRRSPRQSRLLEQHRSLGRGYQTPSLSFGYAAINDSKVFHKTVEVQNYSDHHRTYSITPTFRFPSDATGAVISMLRSTLWWRPHGSAKIHVADQSGRDDAAGVDTEWREPRR